MISLLLVEPDAIVAARFVATLPPGVDVEVMAEFRAARARLLERPPQLLVTAWRLCNYNGLHLAYLAAGAHLPTRSIVYTDVENPAVARESRIAGAFYEVRPRLAMSLPSYATGTLPPADRRDGIRADRRQTMRGGRRAYDDPRPALHER